MNSDPDSPSHPSSAASSLNSTSVLGPPRFDSNISFHWSPENVLVQSWHRKLTDSYKDYNMVNVVGSGQQGAVFIVQHKRSERYYACKMLSKEDHVPDALRREIATLRRLDHPNIVRLYETVEDRDSLCLLMELCHGGDLFSKVAEERRLSEKVARAFSEQILGALAYCHSMGVVHRDVKPENILLETEDPSCLTLKLADFGIAAFIQPSRRRSNSSGTATAGDGQVNGSLPYMAPEMFTKDWSTLVKQSHGSRQLLGAPDLWSCGCVIHFMLSGHLPYGESIAAICSGRPPDFSAEVWQTVSAAAPDLIRRLLTQDMEARWTAQQALRHEWFRRNSGASAAACSGSLGLPGMVDGSPRTGGGAEERHELARGLLRSLKRWHRLPKLKRIAIAAVAKRLENEHPSLRLAQSTYHAFNPIGDKLRCDQLVLELDAALREALSAPSEATPSPGREEAESPFQSGAGDRAVRAMASERSSDSSSSSKHGRSLTGLHVRRNFKAMVKRLSRLSEETPTGNSPSGGRSLGMLSDEHEELVSLTELKYLVDKLDGAKHGAVDYTLLAATLLPPEVYHDSALIAEVFEAFDFRRRGSIRPEDLQKFLSTGRARAKDLPHFASLIAPYDADGDGALDLAEFRSMMLQGGEPWQNEGDLTACSVSDCATPGTELSAAPATPGELPSAAAHHPSPPQQAPARDK